MYYAKYNVNKSGKVGGKLTQELLEAENLDVLYLKIKQYCRPENKVVGSVEIIEGKCIDTTSVDVLSIQGNTVWDNGASRVYVLYANPEQILYLTGNGTQFDDDPYTFLETYKYVGKSKAKFEDLMKTTKE